MMRPNQRIANDSMRFPVEMNHFPTTYVISPQGKHRFWISIMALGFPSLLFAFIFTDFFRTDPADHEWHVSGMAKVFWQFLFLVMLAIAFGVGLYVALFVRRVVVDFPSRSVTRLTDVLG